jgi:1-acyl-sn-glycerol-3-phosphate acyltransferase
LQWLRATVRSVLLLASTLAMFVVWNVGRPCAHLAHKGREWRGCIFRLWSRGLCALLGMRISVRGVPPPAPCVIVSNHLSYLDIVLIGSQVGVVFVSKAEVARWPLVGLLSRSVGTIFVQRDRRRSLPEVNARIDTALERGERVVLFPEGTSSGGDAVGRFKPSLLEPAATGRYPVYCAALGYRTAPGAPPASEAVCWWRDMPFGNHVLGLLRMTHFHAVLEFDPQAHRGQDRKELAQETWRAVARMHGRLSRPPS